MSRKELKALVLKKMANLLSDYGFEKKVYGQSLRKQIQNGVVKIHLSFIDHDEDFDITVDVGIRFNELEELKQEGNKLLTKKEKESTSSIGIELGNLSFGHQKRWTINSELDIESVVHSIFKDIKTYLFPFIKEYSEREKVLKVCIKDDDQAQLICSLAHKRAINAVGLSKILNKTENLEKLVENKKNYLEDKNDYGLEMFIEFVSKL